MPPATRYLLPATRHTMHLQRIIEDVARTEGRGVLASLIRLTGDFDAAEDALQEAYARALAAWARDGVPSNPGGWLNTVARRIAVDRFRRDRSAELPGDLVAPSMEPDDPTVFEDDTLRLLFTCCHPALPVDARTALALRTLGGLTTREIARAYLEPEATTAQRLVRAKRKIRNARIPYEVPGASKLAERTEAVLAVLYLIFNEGYASTDASTLTRPDLSLEAIRLARLAVKLLPGSTEAAGLLALMLLTDARRPARLDADGNPVPLEEQDRTLWDRTLIDEGTALIDATLARRQPGPYQIQAAIAALHDAAGTPEETDWPQILALYDLLMQRAPSPIVELNAAVAAAMVCGPEVGLDRIAALEQRGELAQYHLLPGAKAELLRRAGRPREAAVAYEQALALVTNPAEARYLEKRLAGVRPD